MPLALLGPLADPARSSLRDAGNRATAGLVALSRLVGYPVAARISAVAPGLLALAVHLPGRAHLARQARQIARAREGAAVDTALAGTLA